MKNDPYGRFSAHVKSNMPNMSTCLKVDNIAVGVDINSTIKMPIKCRNNLLKMKTPLAVPPIFLQRISIGSLARFIINT